jgi:hypothetical protein
VGAGALELVPGHVRVTVLHGGEGRSGRLGSVDQVARRQQTRHGGDTGGQDDQDHGAEQRDAHHPAVATTHRAVAVDHEEQAGRIAQARASH